MDSESATASESSREPESYRWSLATLKVQDKVYRVPRHGFTQYSGIFETMFTLPQGDDSTEGRSDDNPIVLPSCTTEEFESLLAVLYPTAPELQPITLSKEHWVHVLKLSTLWDMEEVRGLSIKKISAMNIGAIEKVKLGKEFRVPTWLLEGYLEIIKSWGKTEGRSDDNPIILPSCTTEEFESLLSVLYPTAPHLQPTILSKEQWIHILKVSTLWDMEEVRALSIREILAMNPAAIEKVKLAREFKIPAWLLEGYLEIIKSWRNVGSLDDIGSGLGWESAARLADMARNYSLKRRETVNATVPGAYCNHCARLWKWDGGQLSRSFELSAENPTERPKLISQASVEEPELESATKEAFKAELESIS
ncbi:hypothetical protein D9611_011488 [Ephemerocybe angulata]|uniref:BTB domain-containing protein n=1 Tax=Ephemerocybe angulata TaxID=980116 RepID=A0A8H5CCZ7_9AGAR|nr:hypothetical protein D9611_011488 [Tulosesus angulatus]